MDMVAKFQDQLVFHMTGKRAGDGLAPIDIGALRPALLAGYRDLSRLRYDFPLVLPEAAGADYVHSLSGIVGALIADLAPRGLEGERMRKHVLRLERELRVMVAAGATGDLSELWAIAAQKLGTDADETVGKVLAQAGDALKQDGLVVDCDAALPARFVTQAWRHTQARKGQEFRALVDSLMRKLSDIRRAAFARSAAGQQPKALAASIGSGHADVFDFAVMSKLVVRGAPKRRAPAGAAGSASNGRSKFSARSRSTRIRRRRQRGLRIRVRRLRGRRGRVPRSACRGSSKSSRRLPLPSSSPTARTSRPITTRSSSVMTRTRSRRTTSRCSRIISSASRRSATTRRRTRA